MTAQPGRKPLPKRTLEALHTSIDHWEEVVASPTKTMIGVDHCALCQLFHPYTSPERHLRYRQDLSTMCEGCLVRDATGQSGCRGTPYGECERHDPTAEAEYDLFLAAARAELAFLRSLAPAAEATWLAATQDERDTWTWDWEKLQHSLVYEI